MEDIRLPGPQTRIVMLGNNVFKLKYKLSVKDAGHPLCTDKVIQDDIKNITETILELLSSTGKLVAIKTNNIVVFPGSFPWKKTVYSRLLFSYNGHRLQPHPHIVFLLVHILAPVHVSPKTPVMQVHNGTGICVTPRRHGKRIRPISCCPEDEQLPLMTGIPSSNILARKRLKLENEDHKIQVAEDAGFDPALPTESAHNFSIIGKHSREAAADVQHIAQCAEQTKKRLHNLSQPSGGIAMSLQRDTEDAGSMSSVSDHRSVLQKIVGSVRNLFGWH